MIATAPQFQPAAPTRPCLVSAGTSTSATVSRAITGITVRPVSTPPARAATSIITGSAADISSQNPSTTTGCRYTDQAPASWIRANTWPIAPTITRVTPVCGTGGGRAPQPV